MREGECGPASHQGYALDRPYADRPGGGLAQQAAESAARGEWKESMTPMHILAPIPAIRARHASQSLAGRTVLSMYGIVDIAALNEVIYDRIRDDD